jgi:hypothetical protein
MPASIIPLVALLVIAGLALALALAVTVSAPILAVPFFLFGFIIFLLWRGAKRADARLSSSVGADVPTTSEAAADPVEDSSVGDVARLGTTERNGAA